MSEKRSYYYPFDYNIHKVYTVAFYGSQSPIVCKGSLILRTYYTDDTKRNVDIHHTSEHFIDTIFFETNKIIREQFDDPYNDHRELIELSMPSIGNEYRIIYNAAQSPSQRYDDALAVLADRDPSARGVAIILRRDPKKGICYLKEQEARTVLEKLRNLM